MRLPAFWLVTSAMLLTACASPGPPRDMPAAEAAYAERSATLLTWPGWGLTGRLGIDDGQDGGSGRLDWRTVEDSATLQFRGALGQGAWQLEIDPARAQLELSDGRTRQAPDVDTLVRQEIGWEVPVSALAWWVRGMAWPGNKAPDFLQLNDDGTPAVLEQLGWRVSYDRYVDYAGERLPSRLHARQGDRQVKLAVSRWQGGPR